MSSTPYMKFYIGDYLADTTHLNCLQHGAYFLLILAYRQRRGPLPDADAKLMQITRTTNAEWMQCKDDVLAFFERRDGLLYHKRIDHDLMDVMDISEKRKRAATKKWAKNEASAEQVQSKCNANDMIYHSSDFIVHSSEEEKENIPVLPSLQSNPQNNRATRIEKARAAWNGMAPGIGPACRLLAATFRPDDISDCLRIMTAYTDEEILEAMVNYATLLRDPEADTPKYGSFVGFMRGGVEKFVGSAEPEKAYKNHGKPEEESTADLLARIRREEGLKQ